VPDAALEAITVAPRNLVLVGPNSLSQLHVFGEYSDNVVRDIQKADAGTLYSTSTSQIATITADGMLTAHATGTVTVTVQNGDLLDSIEVTILPASEEVDQSESQQLRFYLPIAR